jgi:hypothetical protein
MRSTVCTDLLRAHRQTWLRFTHIHHLFVHSARVSPPRPPNVPLQEDGVAEAHIWGTGLVVRTKGKSQLFTIADWTDHRVRKLADPSTHARQHCIL